MKINIILELSSWQNQYIHAMECYIGLKSTYTYMIDYHITLSLKKKILQNL